MANDSGNSLLDDANNLLSVFTSAGEKAAGIYSTFLGAQANYVVAQAQKADASRPSSYSPEQQDIIDLGGKAVSYLVYAAIALAVIGTGAVIYKSVKKG